MVKRMATGSRTPAYNRQQASPTPWHRRRERKKRRASGPDRKDSEWADRERFQPSLLENASHHAMPLAPANNGCPPRKCWRVAAGSSQSASAPPSQKRRAVGCGSSVFCRLPPTKEERKKEKKKQDSVKRSFPTEPGLGVRVSQDPLAPLYTEILLVGQSTGVQEKIIQIGNDEQPKPTSFLEPHWQRA